MRSCIENRSIVAFLLSFLPCLTLANQYMPLIPRLFVEGDFGSLSVGNADALLPLYGNPESIFFLNGTAKAHDNAEWLGSVGLGCRTIRGGYLYGGYLFGDQNMIDPSHFFAVNPGLEFMSNEWDAHVNAYLVSDRRDTLATPTFNYFAFHNLFRQSYELINEAGNGIDAIVGYTIPRTDRVRVFGGGYIYSFNEPRNIQGVIAGFEMPLTSPRLMLGLEDSYDNVHKNTALVTVRLTLGGMNKSAMPTIEDRMLDPIPRHLGILATGSGIPTQEKIINNSFNSLASNLWFFDPSGTPFNPAADYNNCTFEHPCNIFSQEAITGINALQSNASLMIDTGTYNNPLVGTGLSIFPGQNLYGRTGYFSSPAFGFSRPLINDSLILNGNNDVYNLQVNGQTQFAVMSIFGSDVITPQVGVFIPQGAFSPINIVNSTIISQSSMLNNIRGVSNQSNATVNLINSAVSSQLFGTASANENISIENAASGVMNIIGSAVFTNSTTPFLSFAGTTFGVTNNRGGIVSLDNSAIAVTSTNGGEIIGVYNAAQIANNVGIINVNGSALQITANNTIVARGIFNDALNSLSVSGIINITNSAISQNSIGFNSLSTGVLNEGSGGININNLALMSTGENGLIFGILEDSANGFINLQNSIVVANGPPGNTFATDGVTDLGGNLCLENGAVVPCS